MSRNRSFQTRSTKPVVMPAKWKRQAHAAVAEAIARKTTQARHSWWAQHASPDARDSFIAAARARDTERERKENSEQWRQLMAARKSAGMQS